MGGYLVVRLVPEAPVDGGTFSSYLDDLQLQVFDAYDNQIPLSDPVFSSPYGLTQWGPLGIWVTTVTVMTTAETSYSTTSKNYGTTLTLDSVEGIPEGAYVFSDDQTNSNPVIKASASYQVVALDGSPGVNTVTLQNPLSNFVPAGTVLTFISQPPSGATIATSGSTPAFSFPLNAAGVANKNGLAVLTFASAPAGVLVGMSVAGSFLTGSATVAEVDPTTNTVTLSTPASSTSSSPVAVNFALEPPYVSFQMTPSSGSGTTLTFPLGGANGIAVGMTVNPMSGLVKPGTTVVSITQQPAPPATPTKDIVTLSQALSGTLTGSKSLTFTFPLSTGIVQHTEIVGFTFGFFSMGEVIGPASVATAVIPLYPWPSSLPPDSYLDITIKASRGSEIVPVNTTFYNVLTTSFPSTPTIDQYQQIPISDTSLYISLPPPAGAKTISVLLPSDGSPPDFNDLCTAIDLALANDPISSPPATVASLIANPANCSRIAYDIV